MERFDWIIPFYNQFIVIKKQFIVINQIKTEKFSVWISYDCFILSFYTSFFLYLHFSYNYFYKNILVIF